MFNMNEMMNEAKQIQANNEQKRIEAFKFAFDLMNNSNVSLYQVVFELLEKDLYQYLFEIDIELLMHFDY